MIASLRLTGTILLVFCGLIASATLMSCENSSDAPPDNTVKIGAMFALTGSGSSLGQTSKAALEVSVDDFNAFLAKAQSDLFVELDSVNTESNPTLALQQLEEMAGRGIKIIVGPQTSAESMALLQRANELGVILLSPSAVANSLSIPNDNFFRMITDVTVQGQANAAYLNAEGKTHLIVVRIGDVWGQDLMAATRSKYEAGGGTVVKEITYTSTSLDAAAVVSQLTTEVASAVATHGAENVGVALFSLGEGITILKEAAKVASLADVKWLGNSAIARDPRISTDPGLVAFSQKVGLPCAVFGISAEAEPTWLPITNKVRQKIGRDADSYALAAYDALWLAAYTVMDAGSDDTQTLRDVLLHNSTSYFGATGWTAMNENGDRATSNFDFWSVTAGLGGQGIWEVMAWYEKNNDGSYTLRKR